MSTCSICCATYNKSTHAMVTCYFPSCSFSGCKECIRTYLTSVTADPHCMNCRNKWSLEFTKASLNAIFMDNDYKNHRKIVLADRSIAQIPEYYEGALRYAHKSEGDLKIAELMESVREHNAIITKLYEERDRIRREMNNAPTSESARKFVMQCQNNGCRGMLTTQYKCELCTKITCSKCFLAIEGERAEHVCKQEDIDTVEELRKNSRPCPTCGTRISKIDGCDQMWCPECKTAFSWSKGTVEKGVIHNPHYYQWMREHGGGMPRNPNDHNNDCGNAFNGAARRIRDIVENCILAKRYYILFLEYCKINRTRLAVSSDFDNLYRLTAAMVENTTTIHQDIISGDSFFSGFHRYIYHMEQTELRPLLTAIRTREEDKTAIYQYILNEIDKGALAQELIRLDNLNMKDRAQCDILEALVVVGKQIVLDCLKELEEETKKYSSPQNLTSKFDFDRLTIFSDKTVKTFLTYWIVHLPQESEALQRGICAILKKYQNAVSKYCAYSNIEFIKYLMTFSSKKTMTSWDSARRTVVRHQYSTKSEMVQAIQEFRAIYDRYEEPSSSASASASASASSTFHFSEGNRVRCMTQDGSMKTGKIYRDRGNKTYDIKFDDGSIETRISEDTISLF